MAVLSDPKVAQLATNKDPTVETALSNLASLEKRIESQETRIHNLEIKLAQILGQTQFSDTSEPASKTKRPILNPLNTELESQSEASTEGFKGRGALATVPLISTPATTDPEYSPILFEDVDFDEIFEHKPHHETTIVTEPKGAEPLQTLLEGIGSPTQLTHHKRIESQSTQDDNLLLDMSDSPRRSDSSRSFSLASEDEDAAAHSFILPKPLKWDGRINWTEQSQFADAMALASMRSNQPPEMWPRSLFQDGLIYEPQKGDVNVYRTVAVYDLPDDIDMKTFLKGIKGGDVYAAHLHNTLYISGSHTGVVTFIYQQHAVAYSEFTARNGVYYNGKQAKVVLLSTPTYPISEIMERNIFDLGHTRCVSIRGEGDSERFAMVARFLRDNVRMYFELGDSMLENDTKTEIVIRFNSIQAAGAALQKLRLFPLLEDCDLDFESDPCSEPLPGTKTKG